MDCAGCSSRCSPCSTSTRWSLRRTARYPGLLLTLSRRGSHQPAAGPPYSPAAPPICPQGIRTEWTERELEELGRTKETSEEETGLHNENGARLRPRLSSRELDRGVYDDAAERVLLDPFYAAPEGKLRQALKCLVRIESLSHVLFWKRAGALDDDTIDWVDLPRLGLLLRERGGRLYSVDHADLAICDEAFLAARPQLAQLLQGLPHALVLVNANNEPSVLLPLDRTPRPRIGASPFTTELVVDRVSWGPLATKYLLLPVHVSLSFIQTPSLLSALYLLYLRFLNRNYTDVLRLVISVGTDTELSVEESAVLKEIAELADQHPNAHAARAHLSLALVDAPPSVRAAITWDLPDNVVKYLNKLAHVSMATRLEPEQELEVLQLSTDQIVKEDAIREILQKYKQKVLAKLYRYLFDPEAAEEVTFQEKKRFEGILEQVEANIERAMPAQHDPTHRDEVKQLIPIALRVQRSPFFRAILRNRRAWLSASVGDAVVLELPPRAKPTNWQWWADRTALLATESDWADAKLEYHQLRGASGIQVATLVEGGRVEAAGVDDRGPSRIGFKGRGRGLWTEARGQQNQSNDPGNNQHILNTPTIGRR